MGSSPAQRLSFNEAGGFLPRKLRRITDRRRQPKGFNEAGGFLPRKPARAARLITLRRVQINKTT